MFRSLQLECNSTAVQAGGGDDGGDRPSAGDADMPSAEDLSEILLAGPTETVATLVRHGGFEHRDGSPEQRDAAEQHDGSPDGCQV